MVLVQIYLIKKKKITITNNFLAFFLFFTQIFPPGSRSTYWMRIRNQDGNECGSMRIRIQSPSCFLSVRLTCSGGCAGCGATYSWRTSGCGPPRCRWRCWTCRSWPGWSGWAPPRHRPPPAPHPHTCTPSGYSAGTHLKVKNVQFLVDDQKTISNNFLLRHTKPAKDNIGS